MSNKKAEAVSLFLSALKSRTKEVAEEVEQVVKKILTPFITIQTGGTTTEELIVAIEANKNEIDVADEITDYAKSMMADEAFVVSKEKGTADLVILSIEELGFKKQPRTDEFMTDEFCAKFSAEHLSGQVIKLCQPEDGPQLRKVWLNQPKDSVVWCAMKRISDSGGDPNVWRVGRGSGGKRWLFGGWVGPGGRWDLGGRFVFRLLKIS